MRAILSVSDKSGLATLGRGLADLGVELVSTGGTAKALAAEGLPVVNVSDVTRFPEMMDGRVKTLHPAIHAGILARRHRSDDLEAIGRHGITPVDLVVVNLYPFAQAAARPDIAFDALVEEIDIGGPSLLRAAGKNFRDVLVVVDPADYPRLLEEMRRPGGASLDFRFELMRKAFAHTAALDAMVSSTMSGFALKDGEFVRGPVGGPQGGRRDLRYGEPLVCLGDHYLRKGDAREALSAYERAVEIHTSLAEAWCKAGDAALAAGDRNRGKSHYESTLTTTAHAPAFTRRLDRIWRWRAWLALRRL